MSRFLSRLICALGISLSGAGLSASLNAETTISLHLAGDSTMSIKRDSARPETGWGEKIASYLRPGVSVVNHAVNGRSTRSFIDQGRWQALLDQLQPNDVVMIQFAHNDQKMIDKKRFTDPWRAYRENLQKFVADVREKEAEPILLTSIARRSFDKHGKLADTLAPYSEVLRDVAAQQKVVLIDLNRSTSELLQQLGPERSKSLYLHLQPGQHPNYPEGEQDDTHLNPQGADRVARMVAEALTEKNHRLIGP